MGAPNHTGTAATLAKLIRDADICPECITDLQAYANVYNRTETKRALGRVVAALQDMVDGKLDCENAGCSGMDCALIAAQRFARLAQAIAKGDSSLASQILRVWGVRR